MKFIKRLLIGLLGLVVLLIAFAFLAPILFKDQIVENVKQSINSSINAEVDFADIDVSFLRSFPAINVRLEDYSVTGKDDFDGYPLATGTFAGVDLDFWSVINGSKTGNYEIEGVELVDPDIRIYVLKNGKANYDITIPSDAPVEEAPATESEMQFNLSKYAITNGRFLYDDRQTETYIEVAGLDHSGKGDFTLDEFELDTDSKFSALTLKQAGVAYLKKAEGELDAIFNIDLANSVYTFKENDLRLNALKLKMDGSIAMPSDDIVFDMSFQAPATDFRQLWSMIPAAYVAGYENVKTTGTFALNGLVKGPFNGEKEIYPAFSFDVGIADGSVQYPGRPVGINGINADIKVNSPSANLDKLTINIPRFGINLGGDPFNGSFRLATPMSDPNIDAKVKGTIDLDKWSQAIPLEGVSELSGKIVADITMDNVRQSVIEAGNYAAVNMSGQASITDLVYAADGLPKVQLTRAQADFSPQFVNVPDFAMQLGKSDFSGRAKIDNLLAYFSPDKTMTGTAVVISNFFDADEWVTEETTSAPSLATAPSTDVATLESEEELFNRFDFNIDAKVGEIKYDTYRIKDSRMNGRFKANELVINDMGMTMGETTLNGNGRVINAWDYSFSDATLEGKLNMTSDFVNVGDFMSSDSELPGEATSEATASTAVIPVPDNIDLVVALKADKVQYTDILLEQMSGNLVIRDKQVVIEDGTTNVLGGLMGFTGAYDTSEPGDPGFRFHYDLKSLVFTQAFKYLNSFKQLAPIGEYLQGKFNSDLVVSGKLGPDLFPKLNTLDAKGFIQTLDAGLSTFAPLEKVGNALNVKELKERINLQGLKSWFTIEQGRVTIEPFDIKIAGIPMTINGTHGLDMAMDYSISAAVPRTMIEGNIVTGAAIGALDQLAGKASQLGLNIEPGDTLNVGIGLTGSIAAPQTKINLLGAKKGDGKTVGQTVAAAVEDRVKQEVDTKVDDAKQEAQDKVDDTKKAAEAAFIAKRDSLKRVADQQAQAIKDQAAQKARDILAGTDSTGIKVPSTEQAQEAVKDIKKELEKFNPFKKKKKDGGGE